MKKTTAIIPVSRFKNAKTRLSPTLTALERENLLKSMLKDVIGILKEKINVVVISSDEEVLDYVNDMGVISLNEKGETDLNGALMQGIEYCSDFSDQILIVPSDIPLIKSEHLDYIIKMGEKYDLVIAPAKGGGTNALLCPVKNMEMKFGDCSFFEHINLAKTYKWTYNIYDSFYMSLDVNTAEDLGEIMLHGINTHTRKFLKSAKLNVRSNHGKERLHIIRSIEK
ncbi:MAG: 2-phospho-L-lactate guanylyltransferase [Methanobacterium sp.]|nr:2-phospho-L-lactate guanylyltransferase [Methanobacterium sp.]